MLKIKEYEPYIILPKQRYNLSTYEPHNVMSNDFTFFIDFSLDSIKSPMEYAILARPGMHMGIMMKTTSDDHSVLSWDFWTDVNGEKLWNNVYIDLYKSEDNLKNDRYFVFVQHNLESKKIEIKVKTKHKSGPISKHITYNGTLVDYSETPYNLGCANYSKVVPARDRLFCSTTIYKLGLLANSKYKYNQIINFIDTTKDDTVTLTNTIDNLVFYFNFNSINLYKVWDLSGHCNFIQKNLYIDEDIKNETESLL